MLTNMSYVHIISVLIFALLVSYSEGQSDHWDGQYDHSHGQSNVLQQLQERIKALEKENLIILPALKILTQEIQNQKEKLTEQESIVKNLASALDVQTSLLLQKDKTISSLEDNIVNLQATLKTNETKEEKLTSAVKDLKLDLKTQGKVMKALTSSKVHKNREVTDEMLHIKNELHSNKESTLLLLNIEVNNKINHFETSQLGQRPSRRYKKDSNQYRSSTNNVSDRDIPSNKMLTKEEKGNILQRNVVDGPVAFHARIDSTTFSHLGINQIIRFDNELLDLGDGYHSTTGIFVAPIKGIYLFSVSLGTWYNEKASFDAVIVKNGNWIAAIIAHGGVNVHQLNQGSVTVAMQLGIGDQVWVKNSHTKDAAIVGWGFSSFTGILIKEM